MHKASKKVASEILPAWVDLIGQKHPRTQNTTNQIVQNIEIFTASSSAASYSK